LLPKFSFALAVVVSAAEIGIDHTAPPRTLSHLQNLFFNPHSPKFWQLLKPNLKFDFTPSETKKKKEVDFLFRLDTSRGKNKLGGCIIIQSRQPPPPPIDRSSAGGQLKAMRLLH
jgi:ribosomal protein L34